MKFIVAILSVLIGCFVVASNAASCGIKTVAWCDLRCAAHGGRSSYKCSSKKAKCKCRGGYEIEEWSCFPGSATVRVGGGATKRMADVKLGDLVQAVSPEGIVGYYPVYAFSSSSPSTNAIMVRITTDADLNITATPGHYMFGWRPSDAAIATDPATWSFVLARDIDIGDTVPVVKGGKLVAARVTHVKSMYEDTGVYAPHTFAGTIVVDGVVASELSSFVPPRFVSWRVQRGLTRVATSIPTPMLHYLAKCVSFFAHGTADASAM